MRSPAAIIVLVLGTSACIGPHLEHSIAATVQHTGDVGGRGAIGMIRGDNGWITQFVGAGDSSGFAAAAGGFAWRQPTGTTPRFELAAGVATRSLRIGGHCTVVNGSESCKDGLGPYGEATGGLDIYLGENAPALTLAAGGTLYLNSDAVEARLLFVLGLAWR